MQIAQVAVRLFAGRSRPAAPRDGQEDQGRDGRATRALRRRRGFARPRPRQGRRDFRPARQIRRLRLQQEPCGGLCADRLLDRLVQGQPPRRVPRRLDDPRQVQHRQARRIPRRGLAARHRRGPAFGQRLGSSISTRAPGPAGRCRSPMRSRRSKGSARPRPRRSSPRAATGPSPRSATSRGASIRARSTRRRSRVSPRRAPSTRSSPSARSPSPRSSRCSRSPTAPRRRRRRGRTRCSARPRRRR